MAIAVGVGDGGSVELLGGGDGAGDLVGVFAGGGDDVGGAFAAGLAGADVDGGEFEGRGLDEGGGGVADENAA